MPEDAELFLNPLTEKLGNPFLLPDMDTAVQRIIAAHENNERIAIWGDYDADGLTSQSILATALKEWGFDNNVSLYTAHRTLEGYGLNNAGIETLYARGVTLIIALDLGTSNVEEVEFAKSLGIDVIICDHHTIKEAFAAPLALINPQRPSDYPYSHFAACGVTYTLVRALSQTFGSPREDVINSLRALVAIGTVADIVPMTGENRILVTIGMKALRDTNNHGLNSLIRISRRDKNHLEPMDIAFGLGPRINAIGRLFHPEIARNILLPKSQEQAFLASLIAEQANRKRQSMTKDMMVEAIARVETLSPLPRVILIRGDSWNRGVVGLVAGRITEKYHRPTLAYHCHNGLCTGSTRSINGIDIVTILKKAEAHLESFGGHQMAAGFSFQLKEEPYIQEILLREMESLPDYLFEKSLYIDMDLPHGNINRATIRDINQLAPFGIGNKMPTFRICNVYISDAKLMGDDQTHLKYNLILDNNDVLPAVAFSQADRKWTINPSTRYDVCGTIGINRWAGEESIQLQVIDFRPSDFIP